MTEFTTDGCSWFPDLWIGKCCVAHDYASYKGVSDSVADVDFLACIAKESAFLGPFAFIFAGAVVGGMALGRPIYRLYCKYRKDS